MTLTPEEIRGDLDRAGMPAGPLNGDGPPGWSTICPLCPGEIQWREGDRAWTCIRNGCDPSAIADAIFAKGSVTYNERAEAGALDTHEARMELEVLYGLDKLGVRILNARIVGRGSRASADIILDNGAVIEFESLRDACRPSTLLPELVASTGARPGLKQAQALEAVALLRKIAEHQVTFTADEIARDWGVSYLQSAEIIDVDIDDQTQRWGAFSTLHRREPRSHANAEGGSIAAASIALRHTDGSRYIRAGWFRDVVRMQDATISPQELAHRMERVGWHRRGKTGRIKATCPGRPDSLAWSFYIVSAGWEVDR